MAKQTRYLPPTHISVEKVNCPYCLQPAGQFCKVPNPTEYSNNRNYTQTHKARVLKYNKEKENGATSQPGNSGKRK